jgi:hypothetical protein
MALSTLMMTATAVGTNIFPIPSKSPLAARLASENPSPRNRIRANAYAASVHRTRLLTTIVTVTTVVFQNHVPNSDSRITLA